MHLENTDEILYRGRRIRPTPEKHFRGGWLHIGHVACDDGVLVVDTKIPLPGLSATPDEAAAAVVSELKRQIDDELTRTPPRERARSDAA